MKFLISFFIPIIIAILLSVGFAIYISPYFGRANIFVSFIAGYFFINMAFIIPIIIDFEDK